MRIFFDSEFTQLRQDSTLISIGLVADNGKEFYAELNDFNPILVNAWIYDNVIEKLKFRDKDELFTKLGSVTFMKGNTRQVREELQAWLQQFDRVELWSDVHHYDVVLLFNLLGTTAFDIPQNIYYIPFDIASVFKAYGLDPDIEREAFIDKPIEGEKHNSLYDSKVIQACYDKLMRNRENYLKKML